MAVWSEDVRAVPARKGGMGARGTQFSPLGVMSANVDWEEERRHSGRGTAGLGVLWHWEDTG